MTVKKVAIIAAAGAVLLAGALTLSMTLITRNKIEVTATETSAQNETEQEEGGVKTLENMENMPLYFEDTEKLLLPLRNTMEALGGTVKWDTEKKQTAISYRGRTLRVRSGERDAVLNGYAVTLPEEPNMINGCLYVDEEVISAYYTGEVRFNHETKQVTLEMKDGTEPVVAVKELTADEENGVLQGYQDDSITVTLWRETVGDATYNVARVKIADPSQFRTGLNHPKARTDNKISAIAEKHNAVVAIGGDYFGKDDYGYVVRMNEVFRKKPSKQRDMLLVDSNGDFHIILQSDADELKALLSSDTLTFPNVFNFGPALVVDGNVCEIPDYYKNKYNVFADEPRCAIGQIGELEYLLVVVDGRRKDSDGCTCAELADFMAKQGCTMAYNLDGGNSALMWFGGENYSEKTVKAERSVSDIIYFATAIDAANTEE